LIVNNSPDIWWPPEYHPSKEEVRETLLFCTVAGGTSFFGGVVLEEAAVFVITGITAACQDGDCGNEAQAAKHTIQKGLDTFSRAAEFRIRSYKDMRNAIKGLGLHAHHIVEQRFASLLGVNPRQMLSVALTPEEHQAFTNARQNAIGRINSLNPINTATATRQDVWLAAQRIYADYPELLEAARQTIFGK
jgi:hypothetical protein